MASAVISFSDKHAAEVNRKALARADPAVEEVIVTVAHSAIYAFEQPRGGWIKLDHEGPLFVVRRSSAPTYRIVLMNRLSTTNFMLDLTADVKVDRKDSLAILHLPNEGLPGVRVFGFWSHSAPELTALVAALQRTVTDTHSPTERKTAPAQAAAPVPSPATSATGSASTSEASDAIKGMLGIGSAPKPASTDAPQKRAAAPGTRGAAQGAVGTRGRRGTSGSPTAAAALGAGAAAGSAATSSGAGASDGAGAGSGRRTAEKQAAKKASNGAGAVGRGAGAAATAKPGLASAAGTALATGSAGITPAAGKPVDRAALRDALVALADDDAFMTAVSRAYEKAMAAKATTAAATAVAGASTAAPSADSAAGAARPPSASTGGRGSGGRGSRRSKGASKRAN